MLAATPSVYNGLMEGGDIKSAEYGLGVGLDTEYDINIREDISYPAIGVQCT